jgi:hypothetical protein
MPPWPAAALTRDLLLRFLPDADPLVFAVDVTTWPRCDAECSPERGYYYHPSRRHSAGQPIIAGWAFQWIAQLGFERDSWTAPVDAARLHPLDDTDHTAAVQVRTLLERLPTSGPVPWFVFDGRLRLRPAHSRPGRGAGGGAGAVAIRPLLLRRPATTATRQHGATPRAGPRAGPLGLLSATRRSRSPPRSLGGSYPPPLRPPGQSSPFHHR